MEAPPAAARDRKAVDARFETRGIQRALAYARLVRDGVGAGAIHILWTWDPGQVDDGWRDPLWHEDADLEPNKGRLLLPHRHRNTGRDADSDLVESGGQGSLRPDRGRGFGLWCRRHHAARYSAGEPDRPRSRPRRPRPGQAG